MGDFLFEDIFTLTRLDPDGKKFDKGLDFGLKLVCLRFYVSFLVIFGLYFNDAGY